MSEDVFECSGKYLISRRNKTTESLSNKSNNTFCCEFKKMETLTPTEKPNLSSSGNTESLPTETDLPPTGAPPTSTTSKPDNEIQETNPESPLEEKIPQLPAHLTPPEPVEI
jgi:hypothetical protein